MKKLMLSTLIILGSSMSFASETSLWKGQINNDEFESKQVLKIEDDGNGIQHLSWQEHRYKNNTLSKIHFDTIFNEDHYEGEYLNKISFALSTGSEQVCYVKYKIEYRMVGDVLAVSLPRLDSYNFYSNRIPKDFCKVMNIPKEAPQRIIYMSRIGKGLSDEALAKLY
ncbi:MAG TPA: hypothetical protein VN132_09545, partial [Bdellovibrio sp.]|nr:hypothetical protein [Bdellovibrio sp.]